MPRLVLLVTISTGLDIHAAADVAQAAFVKALPGGSRSVTRGRGCTGCPLYRESWPESPALISAGLRVVEVGVVPVHGQRLLVGSAFDDSAVVEDDDQVGGGYCREEQDGDNTQRLELPKHATS
jgi:hypothetical protein